MTVVGIDLGTTNSVVASAQAEQMVVATDPRGNQLHPSVISLLPDGTKLFSHDAAARRIIDPKYTIYSAKRLMGQPFRSALVRQAATRIPYEIQSGSNDQAVIVGPDRTYTVPELSGALLLYLRQCTELFLKDTVKGAVLTVPANFNDAQRRATMDAGRIAGLEVLRVINEPTAAALAYGIGRNMSQRIAVYDFGGGTFDVTILQVEGDVFEVLASGGDSFLGGDDIDLTLVGMLATRCLNEHGVDPRGDPTTLARLTVAAEQIKRHLSTHSEAKGMLNGLIMPSGRSLDISVAVTRDELDVEILPLICRTIDTCDEVLAQARLTKSQIDEVILVGGTTRVPLVRQEVTRAFGRTPRSDIDPDLVVAWGAAIQADNLAGPVNTTTTSAPRSRRPVLLDVTPRALGIAVAGGYAEPIVERNAQVPIEQTRLFSTSADYQTTVRIQVCQGESRRFDDNMPLGDLELTGLPSERRGQVRIEVTFRIDTNGILRVRARDPASGMSQEAAVSVRGTMTEAEVAAAAARALEDLPVPVGPRPTGSTG